MRWETKPLSDVVDILDSRRVPVNSTERGKRIGGIPYYGATGHVGFIDEYLFDEELVLLGEDGAPFLDAGKPKAYIVRGKSWVNNHAHVLRGKAGMLNEFLLFQLNHLDYRPYVSGTTRLKLPQGPMKQIPLLVPPLPEQRRIVAEIEKQFSRLEEGVSALKRVQANLKRYRVAVLKAACEGKLVENEVKRQKLKNKSVETGEQLLKRILNERRKNWNGRGQYKEPAAPDTTNLPQLPEGWTWASVESVCEQVVDCHNKTAPYTNNGIPLVRTTNIRNGKINLLETRFVSHSTYEFWSRRCIPNPGDLLFTREAPMGEAGIIPDDQTLCMGQRMMLMRASSGILNRYLLAILLAPGLKNHITRTAVGSGVKHLRVRDVELLPIPLPPLAEQKRIVEEVERRLSVVEELESLVTTNLQRASRLRQAVLQKAFKGELI
jgi:type I restriction enzyme S subunit